MAAGPVDADPNAALQTERDALARRCAAAEAEVQRLQDELDSARAELRDRPTAAGSPGISLFDDAPSTPGLAGDGSDPRVLSVVLGATAIVAGMVTVLALINGKLATPFGVLMIAITIALGWAAARTRVVPVEVSFARGIVYAEQGETSYRFDLRKSETPVEMVGSPGDAHWAIRFPRRHLEPFVIDATMVDPYEFTEKIREFRPAL